MTETAASWPQVFFDWFGGRLSEERATRSPLASRYKEEKFAAVRDGLYARDAERPERLGHPYFTREKPVSLVYDEVETLWAPIAEHDDWSAFEAKLDDIEAARQALDLGDSAVVT